jgi:hypothetical protein
MGAVLRLSSMSLAILASWGTPLAARGVSRSSQSTEASHDESAPRVRGLSLNGFRVDLESTTLSAIRTHLRAGAVARGAGEDADVRQLCYSLGAPSHPTFVVFESSTTCSWACAAITKSASAASECPTAPGAGAPSSSGGACNRFAQKVG